jgi:hypothetical protein
MVYRKANLTQRVLTKGGLVAEYLNAVDPKRRRRMLALVEPIQRLTELLPEIMQGRPFVSLAGGRKFLWYKLTSNPKASLLLRRINRQLAPYVFRRQLPTSFFVYEDEPPALWTNQSRPELKPPTSRKGAIEGRYGIPLSDEYVVTLVLEVAEAAALNRIRQCPNCHQWFMAHRSDQEFCKGECSRESYYEANKQKWPEYQKAYRKNQKEREQYQDKRRRNNVKN